MLLPSHVSRQLEQQQPRATHPLRLEISGAGVELAKKYIAQKHDPLLTRSARSYHLLRTGAQNLCFMGTESFDGKMLALFEKEGHIYVADIAMNMAKNNIPKKGSMVSIEVIQKIQTIRY